jgi:hypothetical protein
MVSIVAIAYVLLIWCCQGTKNHVKYGSHPTGPIVYMDIVPYLLELWLRRDLFVPLKKFLM